MKTRLMKRTRNQFVTKAVKVTRLFMNKKGSSGWVPFYFNLRVDPKGLKRSLPKAAVSQKHLIAFWSRVQFRFSQVSN